jgi:acyl carrier protein
MYADNGSSETLPIGRPIDNKTVRVVDRHGAPAPIGVAGEIVVGGVGVARGYLNQPELTAAQFVADDAGARPGARLYRTGDLGRFDAAGNLHYLGRADGQLKIRGYRIEPGEIESVLRLHPQVRDAVALGLGVGPESRLIAYVVAKGTPPLAIELRSFLALHLPDYMRPAAYVMLPEWPKTINGKIDRQALPRPDALARDVGAVFVGPATDLEQTIAAIWRECLGVAEIGANDNFFDLGGHSLLLVRVHDRLREQFKVDLSLTDLFRFPTIALLAANLKARAPAPVAGEAATRPVAPKATDVGADSRAAMQNAARLQRRNRGGGNRNV